MTHRTSPRLDERARRRRHPTDPIAGIPYRWVAMGVVLFGTFMVVLDTTVVNLGLPSLQRDFGTVEGIEWVVTAYLARWAWPRCSAAGRPTASAARPCSCSPWPSSPCASVLCALSPDLGVLVGARVLQGIGGGLMMPVAMAMIYELFEPHERGKALGYFGIAVMAAPAIGPVLGGSLVSSLGWRWLFLINVPIGLRRVPRGGPLLRDTGYRDARPLDRVGLGLSGVGLAAFLIGVSKGASWGWTQPGGRRPGGRGVVLLAVFVRHAPSTPNPLVEMRILANPVFAVGMVAIALLTVAQYSRLVYIPLELGTVRDISEFRIGLIMLPSALGIAMTMPDRRPHGRPHRGPDPGHRRRARPRGVVPGPGRGHHDDVLPSSPSSSSSAAWAAAWP